MPTTATTIRQENEGGNARARFLRGLCVTIAWAILSIAALALIPPPAGAATAERTLGANLVYRVPAGYSAVQQPGGVLMGRDADLAQGKITGLLLTVPEISVDAATAQQIAQTGRPTFAQALAISAGNFSSDPNATIGSAQRIATAVGETYRLDTTSFDRDAGQQRHSRFEIVFVGDVIHIFIAAGYGAPESLTAQLPGFASLRSSARYRNQGAPAPRDTPPPLPTDLAALTQQPAPQAEAAQSGKICRIVQRQMCSGGIGTSLGYFCNTYPQQVCE